MPTTVSEASNIIRIVSRYLPLDKATQLVVDLWAEVGSTTENDSLRVTLEMLREELEEARSHSARQSLHSINGTEGLRTYSDKR